MRPAAISATRNSATFCPIFSVTGVGFGESARLIVRGGLHHARDARRVHLDHRRADAVGSRIDGDLAAVRRVGRFVDIVHAEQRGRMAMVQLDEDLLGLLQKVGAQPTDEVSTMPPPAVTSLASTTAQCTGPRKP